MRPISMKTWKEIAKIGAINVSQLQNNSDFILIWRNIRDQSSHLLELGGESIGKIGRLFPTFYIDMWSDSPWHFDTKRNHGSLVIRLWSLLFPTFPFEFCGGLVHEADHREYLINNNLVDKPDSVQEKHIQKMEISANKRQLIFLKQIEKHVEPKISVIPGTELVIYIEDVIKNCEMHLHSWERSENYSKKYERNIANSLDTNNQFIAKALGIDLDAIPRMEGGINIQFWA